MNKSGRRVLAIAGFVFIIVGCIVVMAAVPSMFGWGGAIGFPSLSAGVVMIGATSMTLAGLLIADFATGGRREIAAGGRGGWPTVTNRLGVGMLLFLVAIGCFVLACYWANRQR